MASDVKHLAVSVALLRNGFTSLFPLAHCSSERLQKGSGFEVKRKKKERKKKELKETTEQPGIQVVGACAHPKSSRQ